MLDLSPARRHGVFYTPDRLALALTRWALRGGASRVLDPSCGDGRFIRAAAAELGGDGLVRGIDIDEAVVQSLSAEQLPGVELSAGSFFDGPASPPYPLFDAVVGNPPYVRHHSQSSGLQEAAHRCVSGAGITLSKQADLWAPFVVHSTQHVALGGRLGLILPIAATYAGYASEVWRFLQASFGAVETIVLRDRAFENTREQVVILLASQRGGNAAQVRATVAATLADVESLLAASRTTRLAPDEPPRGVAAWKWDALDESMKELWSGLYSSELARPLEDHARIRIGVVTGANGFFVRLPDDPLLAGPGVTAPAILGTSRLLRTPSWTGSNKTSRYSKRLLVIDTDRAPRGALADAIAQAELHGLHQRHHCALRAPWWALTDIDVSDAFLGYMGASAHALVRNSARALCTNAVHRVDWRGLADPDGLTASSWSSLFRMSAELFGRHYGGGVLKLEPAAAKRLPLLDAREFVESFPAVDKAASRSSASSIAAADRVLGKVFGLTPAELSCLSNACDRLERVRRLPVVASSERAREQTA